MAMAALLEAQAELRGLSSAPDGERHEALRLRAAAALDAAQTARGGVRASDVEALLLKPPWRSARIGAAALRAGPASDAADGEGAWDVMACRQRLCAARPHASRLLCWLDERAAALEPYRRLSEARHMPWADASVRATVAAVRRGRAQLGRAPTVLVADGSLGVEASAAAAAGARVLVCESNRFAATAIAQVAHFHGVGHAVTVLPVSLEDYCSSRGQLTGAKAGAAGAACPDVVVLSPLLDQSGCDRRIIPAARAVARWREAVAASPAWLVPERVRVLGAAGCLSAGVVCGVDLRPLDAARWTGPALAVSAELEEGGVLLSPFEPIVELDLRSAGCGAVLDDREVVFCLHDAGVSAGRNRCFNAIVLDLGIDWRVDARGEAEAGAPTVRTPHKRAVQFLEPLALPPPTRRVCVSARCNGVRLWFTHAEPLLGTLAAAATPLSPSAPLDWWGRLLIQQWHYAMLRDDPRNEAYAAALARAAAQLSCGAGGGAAASIALDVGCGSGLLSLLLARAGGPRVVGIEILQGLSDLGRRCVEANGAGAQVEIVRSEAARLCSAPPPGAPRASLLLAELMDGGGLGESLLGLAAAARRGGMLEPGALMLPRRLRVWATLVELHRCGTALDSAELMPSLLSGVALHPWLHFRHQSSYSAIDLAAAEYAPLSAEALVYEALVGDEPPPDATLTLRATGGGVANAVVWVWEADLDDSGAPPLTNAPWAPRTHWRQAVRLVPEPRAVREGDEVRLSVATGGGRELAFEIRTSDGGGAPQPLEERPHVRRSTRGASSETPAASSVARASSGTGVPATTPVTLVGGAPGASSPCSGGRWLSRSGFRGRRAPTPSLPRVLPGPDGDWLAALKNTEFTAARFGLQPTGCADSVRFCEAALDIAAQPAMLGVSAAEAQQAVRVLYAN